jgi:hypothetical protein
MKELFNELDIRTKNLEGGLDEFGDRELAKYELNQMVDSINKYEDQFMNFSKYLKEETDELRNLYGEENFKDFKLVDSNVFYEFGSHKKDSYLARKGAKTIGADISGLPKKLNYLDRLN